MARITQVHAREVLDSRGDPTVEVDVRLDDGSMGTAIVPAGKSTGRAEAVELRDQDVNRYGGRGVRRAVQNVNLVLGPELKGRQAADQASIDARLREIDGTENKSRLGANAILGVSLATAHASAAAERIPLFEHIHRLWRTVCERVSDPTAPRPARAVAMPQPMTNMISGGLHANANLDYQDFLIIPHGAPNYEQGLEWLVHVYRCLGTLLGDLGYEGRLVGDEGGFGPRLPSNREAALRIVEAIERAGLQPGRDVALALDVASTHFFDGACYRLAHTGDRRLSSGEMIEQLAELVDEFPIVSIEDGLAEEDWEGWQALTRRLGDRVRLVGDDLFATNESRLRHGIESGVANSVLIKVNQIGTLSETLECMRTAWQAGYSRVVSGRSGETEDATIADLAVGTHADLIKIGSIVRGERLAKYNRLLRISETLSARPGA